MRSKVRPRVGGLAEGGSSDVAEWVAAMVAVAREHSQRSQSTGSDRPCDGWWAVRPSPLETRRLLGAGSLRGFFAFV